MGLSRRRLLKTASAVAGAAIGSDAVRGFPTIWAQNIKDVELRHAGMTVTAFPAIGEQATKDLGFKVTMQAVESLDLLNRFLTQPNTMDIADVSIPYFKYVIGRGVFQTIPQAKFKNWDATLPLFTKSEYADGRKASKQGVSPYTVLYATDASGNKLATEPTEFLTSVPTITNADTLGIRPDLVGRPITSWADLISPDFKGKSAVQDNPTIGIIDVAMALEARGDIKYGNKGNMTKEEIDKTIDAMTKIKQSGQFRSFWTSFDQSVNLMASGEVVIQSMWSPAVTAVRTRGIPCTFQPLKEGYRGWGYHFGILKHLTGLQLDCAIEYMNWYTSGFPGAFIAREGYYCGQPLNAKKYLSQAEWDYWYGGKPATEDMRDPFGKILEKAGGPPRDGGSYEQRLGNIAVWNSVMDQDKYLIKRWNEFVTA
jgi:putative spermidine/putrescine transport system substrate-binding protein